MSVTEQFDGNIQTNHRSWYAEKVTNAIYF